MSTGDNLNLTAYYFQRQLDFHNLEPEDILQLFQQLSNVEEKVRSLEEEINGSSDVALRVMPFKEYTMAAEKHKRLPSRKKHRKSKHFWLSRFLICSPKMKEPPHKKSKNRKKYSGVTYEYTVDAHKNHVTHSGPDGALQFDRNAKVSWEEDANNQCNGDKGCERLRSDRPIKKSTKDIGYTLGSPQDSRNPNSFNNVVHVKLRIPKYGNDQSRENLTVVANSDSQKKNELDENIRKSSEFSPQNSHGALNKIMSSIGVSPKSWDVATQMVAEFIRPNDKDSSTLIEGTQAREKKATDERQCPNTVPDNTGNGTVGISVKEPGKSTCGSHGCKCIGSTKTANTTDKVRKSFGMTESEGSLLDEVVQNPSPDCQTVTGITEFGSMTIETHIPQCACKICETFGQQSKIRRKGSMNSNTGETLVEKIVRVPNDRMFRNVVTHTEECGCDICTKIEEITYQAETRRQTKISTHDGTVVVTNKGVCGCVNCKTIEIERPTNNFEGPNLISNFNRYDPCYYSDATIPSLRSFPKVSQNDFELEHIFTPSISSVDSSGDSNPGPIEMITGRQKLRRLSNNALKQYTMKQDYNDSSKSLIIVPPKDLAQSVKKYCVDGCLCRSTEVCICDRKKSNSKRFFSMNYIGKRKKCHCENCCEPSEATQRAINKINKNKSKKSKSWFASNELKSNKSKLATGNSVGDLENTNIFFDATRTHPPLPHSSYPPNRSECARRSSRQRNGSAEVRSLEHIIHDLISGHEEPYHSEKSYIVTLGDKFKRPYAKLKIINGSSLLQRNLPSNHANSRLQRYDDTRVCSSGAMSEIYFVKPILNISNSLDDSSSFSLSQQTVLPTPSTPQNGTESTEESLEVDSSFNDYLQNYAEPQYQLNSYGQSIQKCKALQLLSTIKKIAHIQKSSKLKFRFRRSVMSLFHRNYRERKCTKLTTM